VPWVVAEVQLAATAAPSILLSVVIPVYRAENLLPELCDRLTRALRSLTTDFEIILVDDRSPDRSWNVLLELLPRYPNVTAIRLSRNFGQHYAITAGLDFARGQWTVVMDCDLQDQPEEIGLLLRKAQEGYDIVLARRIARQHPWPKRLASRTFYWMFARLSGYTLDSTVGSFRIMERRVVEAFCQMREAYRLFGGMIEWLGFSVTYVDTQHAARADGRSTYTWMALMRVALDGILSFSNRPLYISAVLGATMSVLAAAYVFFVVLYLIAFGRVVVPGWLSLVVLTTFVGGLILFNLGIIGIYLGRLYGQVKQRPLYVIDRIAGGRSESLAGRSRRPSDPDPQQRGE
jgi:glycosyltransferase involved in cell wall biosynthesis